MTMEYRHTSVLVTEVVNYLHVRSGGVYVDATFGGGGHTRAILDSEVTCQVIGLDWDQNALAVGQKLSEQYEGRLRMVWGNFARIADVLAKEGVEQVDGILADVGTSQFQLSHAAGFSFKHDSPLDMRMSPAHQKVTAAQVVNKAREEKLRHILWDLGEEREAKRIVQALVEERKKKPIETTVRLAQIIERVVPRRGSIHPATRTFQALRIYVNHELENIKSFLPAALRLLKPKGRLVVISFHSLEDRIVKHTFAEFADRNEVILLTPDAVVASEQEVAHNSSSRSAKLRAVERV